MSLSRSMVVLWSASVLLAGCSSLPFSKEKRPDTGPKMSEKAYYEEAQRSLNGKQFDDAVRSLEALETYYPVGVYTEQSQLDLMYSRFRQSDFATAASLADRFIRLYPNNPQLDYAYYLRGVSNMEVGYDGLIRYTSLNQAHRDVSFLRLAYDNFNEFLQRYPNSRFAPDVTQRLRYIVNQFAESEMNVARFNLKRKAWVAAAQRARWVVDYYPQTPQTPEALATLAYSYQQLGMNDLAKPYIQLLQINYPKLISGQHVNLAAAREEASWLNRLTLGIAGRRARADIGDVAPPSSTHTQEIVGSVQAENTQQAPLINQAEATKQATKTPNKPQVRLGLPESSDVNNITDPQPAQ